MLGIVPLAEPTPAPFTAAQEHSVLAPLELTAAHVLRGEVGS